MNRLAGYTIHNHYLTEKAESGCWLWKGHLDRSGYGHRRHEGKWMLVHRIAYIERHGAIPKGMHLDHLCRVRNCVNPRHLEPVTPQENARRGSLGDNRPSTCRRGHELTGANLYWRGKTRWCRTCNSLRSRKSYAAKKATQAISAGELA